VSNQFGYVYVLTNPSMPGLVKVGKTTTTPNQRMSELHSTGVPTPFELECSISIKNCHDAERAAHKVLNYCRESNNREFFRIPANQAIEKILEVVDECEIVDFRDAYGIKKIEEEVQRRKKIKENDELRKKSEIEKKRKEQEAAKKNKQILILRKLNDLNERRKELGPRPIKQEPGIWAMLGVCYLPLPYGWIFWLGALSVFGKNSTMLGLICIALIISGHIADHYSSEINERNEKISKPFKDMDDEISLAERQLKDAGYDANSPIKDVPKFDGKKVERIVFPNNFIATDSRGFEKPARKIGRVDE
jgi:hypothetical protein